ncbi:hypothetical protein [Hyphomonas sp. GM-8P]|uniref:hypothetical protein n=1 Tax=Hyphomonas sp. GM-8P TaxID=1280945 RepID=UPI000DBF7E50|nr:hypothetical protein [Hyphomonas sp. GM-8P]RAN40865.1 hypothetical protein HY26_10740 [Hyphomonas sp. GM-8P]|tara:strand:- start:1905 stop:2951 length:1047 start_codon:yes stop_codon:yes gene_type:complete
MWVGTIFRYWQALTRWAACTLIGYLWLLNPQTVSAAEVQIVSFDPNADIFGIPFSEQADKNFGQPFIVIKGEIVLGDFEHVQSAAQELANANREIVIALESPGGNVVEALKIAQLVRENWITTWIYGRTAGVNDTDRSLIVCDSACAYIFFAGVERRYSSSNMLAFAPDDPHYIAPENRVSNDFSTAMFGAILGTPVDPESMNRYEAIPPLGLHRPYLDPSLNRTLSGSEAQQAYKELESMVRSELSGFGVPASLIDRMMKASSSQIIRIGSDELRELMPSYDPWFEEWQLSKCGVLSLDERLDLTAIKNPSDSRFSESYRAYLLEKEASIESCEVELRLQRQKQIAK